MTADEIHPNRLRAVFCAALATLCGAVLALPTLAAAATAPYVPGVVVVGIASSAPAGARDATLMHAGMQSAQTPEAGVKEIELRRGVSVAAALARLRGRPGVRWAVPDYIAHVAGAATLPDSMFPYDQLPAADQLVATPFFPDDPGSAGVAAGWEQLQWNFDGQYGVQAPQAWGNLIADGRPGGYGAGVIVAVLDTGVAYADHGSYVRSPDFSASEFVAGYDFVSHSPYPEDRNGHGTQVAGTIAEETNNGVGVTGLAYGVRLMPVRVLDAQGNGSATTIAKGIVFAVRHHAQIINLSLEFDAGTITAADIPQLISAIDYAHSRNVLVVAAAGNESLAQISYPAKAPNVIAVGATTIDGCLAFYSNYGPALSLVAPGGGGDANVPGDANCQPSAAAGPADDIYQETFANVDTPNPHVFGLPSGYFGTSMAAPHVSAVAALILASGVLGPHPTVAQLTARLEQTATPLGPDGRDDPEYFGAGLVNAAAATAPSGSTGSTGSTGTSASSGASGATS
ncbi:MAG: S8 family serine peptidase [Solirubrobacteraceae bacterium]|jgi:serine protease